MEPTTQAPTTQAPTIQAPTTIPIFSGDTTPSKTQVTAQGTVVTDTPQTSAKTNNDALAALQAELSALKQEKADAEQAKLEATKEFEKLYKDTQAKYKETSAKLQTYIDRDNAKKAELLTQLGDKADQFKDLSLAQVKEIVSLANAQAKITENQQLSGLGVLNSGNADPNLQKSAILNGTDNKAKIDLFKKTGGIPVTVTRG